MTIIVFIKNEDGVIVKKTENDLAGTHLKPIIYFYNPESENNKWDSFYWFTGGHVTSSIHVLMKANWGPRVDRWRPRVDRLGTKHGQMVTKR